jgi:CheY-like chemotaxis protein
MHVDLLLTDLAMPRLGGIELADLAKRLRPHLKVLYTSAYVRVTGAGAPVFRHGPFLEKPWRLRQLCDTVERLIGPGRHARDGAPRDGDPDESPRPPPLNRRWD